MEPGTPNMVNELKLSLLFNTLQMLKSLYLYTKNISSLLFQRELGIVLNDLRRYNKRFFSGQSPEHDRELALELAMEWLLLAAEHMPERGGSGQDGDIVIEFPVPPAHPPADEPDDDPA